MSYWLIPSNGTVVSKMTVSRVTNIEAQTDKNTARATAFCKVLQKHLNANAHVMVERGKGEPKDFSGNHFNRYPDFDQEFSHVITNEEVPEDDDNFSPDVYDDTYISMDLSVSKRG